MDPNLLPQDMRSREEKERERQQGRPRTFEIDLQEPMKEKNGFEPITGDKLKTDLSERLFGGRQKPAPTQSLTSPLVDRAADFGTNLLSQQGLKPEVKPVEAAPKAGNKPALTPHQHQIRENKDGWFKGLFGRPVSPIISNTPKSEIISEPKSFSLPKLAEKPTEPVVTKIPIPEFKSVSNQVYIKKETVEKKAESKSGSYHLAPKHDRAGEVSVNLIPEDILAGLKRGTSGNLAAVIITVVVCALIVTVLYGALMFLEQNLEKTMTERKSELDQLSRQIGDYIVREKKNNLLADQVSVVKKLLAEKILWSKFFALLEKYTLDGVYFTSLTADTSGVLTLPGVADDYHILAQQLAALREAKDLALDAKMLNAQLYSESRAGVVGVSFQLKLNLNDQVFKRAQ